MKSKKSKSKKKPKSEVKTEDQLSEVDKTFYELQIADLNRKLTRLTNLSIELEQRNETLTTNNRLLDEDRADVIAYLKKTVQNQSDEIVDLLGRLEALKATLKAENLSFQEQLAKKDDVFKEMQTHLKSEINLLEGKLNALEEFRIQRDELNKKFEEQGLRIGEQEKTHKEEMYAVERKFITDKDTLIKQMEQKLKDVAKEFQNVTDMRITESTQRMIRENIAVNNENIQLVQEQKELYKDRDELLEKCRTYRLQKELAVDQCKLAVKQSNLLKKVVEELTSKCEEFQVKLQDITILEDQIMEQNKNIEKLNQNIQDLQDSEKLLQENLKDSREQRKLLLSELTKTNTKSEFLTKTLFEAIFKIRQRLKQGMSDEQIDKEREVEENILEHSDEVLNELYNMFLSAKEAERECKHLETWVQFYRTGCAGFVPRPRDIEEITEKNQETQIGVSFEEFLAMDDQKQRKKSKKLEKRVESEGTTIPSDFSST